MNKLILQPDAMLAFAIKWTLVGVWLSVGFWLTGQIASHLPAISVH